VHEAVVDIIERKIATATDAASLMDRSIVVHRQVLAAIRAGDGELAARLGREALYDYYADYVEPGQRGLLDAAVE
jgi:GntR family transcriptional repressor for pyruvate dehydrogenase complex